MYAIETLTPEEFAVKFLPILEARDAARETPERHFADRDTIRSEFEQVWGPGKMLDYCVKKTALAAILPGGEIVIVEKHSIETRFCFGESGYDYDDALRMAQHARTNADYFKDRNMEHFNGMIDAITASMNGEGYQRLVIYTNGAYCGQPESCRLRNFGFARLNDIIDACGGSCHLEELPGKALRVCCQDCRIATAEEHAIILDAYREAAKAHEKKVDAYLKRYGTSKVQSWTYWRDA